MGSDLLDPAPTDRATASRSDAGRGRGATIARAGLPWFVSLFLIAIFIPWLWTIGGVVLSPFRVVLLATILPCVGIWISGKAGGIRAADIGIILYCLWSLVSLAAVHGLQTSLQSGGIITVETLGAYLLARCFIRGPEQFYAMARLLFILVAILSVLAIAEVATNSNVTMNFFAKFFPTHGVMFNEPRFGLRRVQTVFEHPILFGVTCGAVLALVHMVLGRNSSGGQRWLASGTVLFTAALSMSSGPITVLLVQIFLISWNWVLRDNEMRWKILWGVVFAIYALVSLVSNQTVPEFFFTHFSIDPASAYYRVLIWQFGSESVANHLLFGVGFGRWDRPDWMPPSIDMFWLYHAIVFGLPAAIFIMSSLLLMLFAVARRKDLDEKNIQYRTAYIITMVGYFLAGWIVHFWNGTYVLFLFLLGSGAWLVDFGTGDRAKSRAASDPDEEAAVSRRSAPGGRPRPAVRDAGRSPRNARPGIGRTRH